MTFTIDIPADKEAGIREASILRDMERLRELLGDLQLRRRSHFLTTTLFNPRWIAFETGRPTKSAGIATRRLLPLRPPFTRCRREKRWRRPWRETGPATKATRTLPLP